MSDPLNNPGIIVRHKNAEDVPNVAALQRRVYPEVLAWTEEELYNHLRVFSEGQFVAMDEAGKAESCGGAK